MKHVLIALIACFVLTAHAVEEKPKKEPTQAQKEQRERMKTCNQEAKTQALKGDERKAFMKECLSSKTGNASAKSSASAKNETEKEKSEQCKQEAREKKLRGDERKTYLAACLEG